MDAQPAAQSGRRHLVAACVAVAISLLLHALAVSRFPAIPLGQILEAAGLQDFRAVVLREVSPVPALSPAEIPRYRPENPSEVESVLGGLRAEGGPDWALPVPQLPEATMGLVIGKPQSLWQPDVVPVESAWDARQEILEIQQPRLDDREAALPRMMRPAAERRDRVPDITLPVEQPSDLVLALGGSSDPGIETASRPLGGPEVSLLGVLLGLPVPDGQAVQEEARREMEAASAVEPPVDQSVEAELGLVVESFSDPADPQWTYVRLVIQRRSGTALPVLPRDVLLMQDCSESITPSKLAECKRGLRRWVDTLNPGDRFNLVAFRDTVETCFPSWAEFGPASRAAALAFIDALRAYGNTDVYASLQAALAQPRDPHRPLLAVLVTDGRPTAGVTASSSIIESFSAANDAGISVFALGGGQRVNRFLLDLLSYRNRGDSLIVSQQEVIPEAMRQWAESIRRPVLTDLSHQFTGGAEAEVYPETLTHLYLDRPLMLIGRLRSDAGAVAFQIRGQHAGRSCDMVFPIDLATARPASSALREQWAWQRIYTWIGRYLREPDPVLLTRIQEFADEQGLVVPYGFGRAVPRW